LLAEPALSRGLGKAVGLARPKYDYSEISGQASIMCIHSVKGEISRSRQGKYFGARRLQSAAQGRVLGSGLSNVNRMLKP